MAHYKGLDNDTIVRGGKYVDEHHTGHEVCNFLPYKGFVYGYVQPTGGGQIHIENINNDLSDKNEIDNVTVVWISTKEKRGKVVIGWYNNAKVYRRAQNVPKNSTIHKKNRVSLYFMKTAEDNAFLLPVKERTLKVPHCRSNVWYAKGNNDKEIVNNVLDFIKLKKNKYHYRKSLIGIDQERKLATEKSAIDTVVKYYLGKNYQVYSVESDNFGWDLEAKREGRTLRIEVKGLSGTTPSIELTPNEYRSFSEKKEDYRLAIVTNALEEPHLHICRYVDSHLVVNGTKNINVKVEERTGAKILLIEQ